MPRVLSSKSTLLGVLTGVTLLVSFKLADASTFALIADLENGTIYRGYLSQNLADLTPLPLNGVMRPVAVDYDPVEGMVYWTDQRSESAPKICRAHLDGSNQTTVVGDLTDPGGMALDVASRMLYWTDGALAHIGRARMDGTGSKEILLSENHYNPKGIVVDSVHGHIFWSDWGENPRIERADLDGNNRRIVVQGGLSYPSSVTIDFNGNSLYWIDAIHDTIETSDLSGSNRRLVANLTVYSLSFPFDLAVYGDYVYWTEWGMYPTILRVHLDGRGAETIGPSIFQMPGGIHIQEEEEVDSTPPVVTGCPNEGVFKAVPLGYTSANVTWTPPTASDDSGMASVTMSSNRVPGQSFNLGRTHVQYNFTDAAGNQAFCDFVVTVSAVDSTNPTISCPPTIVRYVRSATQQLPVSWQFPTASDDSGNQPTITSTPNYPTSSGTFGAGMHSVTYLARDGAGNQASCILTINIILDSRIPTITGCPGRTIAVLPPGSSSVAVSWTEPVGADDNGVVNMTRSHRPGNTFTLGNATVTYTFTDQAGNQATCRFTVSVSRGDVTNPVISCPPTIVRYVRTATQQLSVSWPSPTASDDSGIQPTITSTPNYPTPSGTFGAGMHSVVYSARDEAGNQASCTLWINIILDSQAPTMAGCPGTTVVSTGNRSVDVSWTEPVSIDANGVVNMTRSHRPGDRFAVGDTFVRYTFTDRAGNQATCTFTVRVVAGCLLTPDQFDHLEVVSGQQSVYLPGESVQLTCQDGYQLSGSASRFCRSDLTWSGEPAVCVQQGEPMGGTVVGFGAGASGVLLLILLLLVVIFLIRRRKKTRVRAPDLAITAQITTQGDLGIYDNPQPVYETVVRGAAAPPPKEEETALSEVKPPLPSTPTPGYPPPSYEYAHADRHNYNLPPTYIPME
ncbi:hyalin-like isoform X2 [Acanthaster planci]|uniref:Hyalin-like isoform X2 n=1 Tax=Acanthaster planci TaxID=133434 RepID=A0A8B7YZF1_ACAPL|nr:hyalin-like isoform X2 [Acanthaster planci]